MSLKALFSLKDFSLKGRASAMHYRTMMGRLNLWAILFIGLCALTLYGIGFPMADFIRSLIEEDAATLDGIVQMMRMTEIVIFLIAAAMLIYIFILSIGAMAMRLHDFGRSAWWAAPVVIVPAFTDSLFVDVMYLTQIGWFVLIVSLIMLYKSGDFGKNAHGYENDPKEGYPLSLQLISFLPIIFIIADLAMTVFLF